MVGAIDSLERMIADNGIDCDYERSGFLRVATTQAYAGRIRKEVEFFQSLGIDGFEWVEPDVDCSAHPLYRISWRVLGARLRQPQPDEVGRRPARARIGKGRAAL